MRKLSDTGLSANQRYDMSSNKNGKQLATSQIIRLFANYNKCRRVLNSMIKVECQVNGKSERHWFTIWDEKIKSRYNGDQIRVRMALTDPSVVYLFDPNTDTYLGYLNKDYEPAGDRANQTPGDIGYMANHHSKVEQSHSYRVQQRDKILEDIESSEIEKVVHESLLAPLLLTNSTKRTESEDTSEGAKVEDEMEKLLEENDSKRAAAELSLEEIIPELEPVTTYELSNEEIEVLH